MPSMADPELATAHASPGSASCSSSISITAPLPLSASPLTTSKKPRSRTVAPSSASLATSSVNEETPLRRSERKRKMGSEQICVEAVGARGKQTGGGRTVAMKHSAGGRKKRKSKDGSAEMVIPLPTLEILPAAPDSVPFTFPTTPLPFTFYSFLPPVPTAHLTPTRPSLAVIGGVGSVPLSRRPPLYHSSSAPIPGPSTVNCISLPSLHPQHNRSPTRTIKQIRGPMPSRPSNSATSDKPSMLTSSFPLPPHLVHYRHGLLTPPVSPNHKPCRRGVSAQSSLGPLERTKKHKLAHLHIRSALLLAGPTVGFAQGPPSSETVNFPLPLLPAPATRSTSTLSPTASGEKQRIYNPTRAACDVEPKWLATPASAEGKPSRLCPDESCFVGSGSEWLHAIATSGPVYFSLGGGTGMFGFRPIRVPGAPLMGVPGCRGPPPPNCGGPNTGVANSGGSANQQAPLKAQLLAILRMRAGSGPGEASTRFKKWVLWNAWMRRDTPPPPPMPAALTTSQQGPTPLHGTPSRPLPQQNLPRPRPTAYLAMPNPPPHHQSVPATQVYDENGDPINASGPAVEMDFEELDAFVESVFSDEEDDFCDLDADEEEEGEGKVEAAMPLAEALVGGAAEARLELAGGVGTLPPSTSSPMTPPRVAAPLNENTPSPPTPVSPPSTLSSIPRLSASAILPAVPVLHTPRPKISRSVSVPGRLEGFGIGQHAHGGSAKENLGTRGPLTPPPSPPPEGQGNVSVRELECSA